MATLKVSFSLLEWRFTSLETTRHGTAGQSRAEMIPNDRLHQQEVGEPAAHQQNDREKEGAREFLGRFWSHGTGWKLVPCNERNGA